MDSNEISPDEKIPAKVSGSKIVAGLVIFAFIAFKFHLFSSGSPEDIIKNFDHAIAKGDVQKALGYLDTRRLDVPRVIAYTKIVHEQIDRKGGIKNIDVVSLGGGGDGMYSATIFFNNGETEVDDVIKMVKDDSGNWKIGQTK